MNEGPVVPRTQAGGALGLDALYIARPADNELPTALEAGEFRYVLAPRQIGKSSLRVRTEQQLSARGVRCAVVDITRIGSRVDAERWYRSMADEIAEVLALYDTAGPYWEARAGLAPALVWSRFLRDVVLARVPERIVVFVDEIDSILAVPGVGDDFFAAVRALRQDRTEFAALERLTFCLLGVASPSDLIQDFARTPFNVGDGVRLEDFTRPEADGFLPVLAGLTSDPTALLDAIFAWTDGHPYMTHRLVHELVTDGALAEGVDAWAHVDGIVMRVFLRRGHQEEPNLRYADDRFTATTDVRRAAAMLSLYRRARGGERVSPRGSDEVQHALRLTGMVAERRDEGGSWLACRNRIFREVFDEAWIAQREQERFLAGVVARWRESKQGRDTLLRGDELTAALAWAEGRNDVTPEERSFLDASRELRGEEARAAVERRSTRRLVAVLGAFVLTLLAAIGVVYSQYRRAQAELVRAEDGEAREKGRLALALARDPGSEPEAVERGLQSVFEFKDRDRVVPSLSMQGLYTALVALHHNMPLRGHTGALFAASFSPDGSRVVTASWDTTARIWDARSGQLQVTLQGHSGVVGSASFSADGRRVVTGGDRTARLWDAHSGQLQATLPGHTDSLTTVSFSPDGSCVLTASRDHTARVWDARSGHLQVTLQGHTDWVAAASFSPDGSRVVTASWDRTARVWDARSGQLQATLQGHWAKVTTAAFSPDGVRVVTASEDGTARVWDVRTGRLQINLEGHTAKLTAASFSSDGSRVVTASWDQTARVWDARSGQLQATLQGHWAKVTTAAFSPDGVRVVTASEDGTARVWDARTGQPQALLRGHTNELVAASFSADSSRVLTASWDQTARVWDLSPGQLQITLQGHTGQVTAASFSSDGVRVASASWDQTARVWDARSGRLQATLRGHAAVVNSASFSPDDSRVVTASKDGTARLWDAHSGQLQATLQGHRAAVDTASFSPDGSRAVTASRDRTTRLWDAWNGQLQTTFRGHRGGDHASTASFSPDGSRIVTSNDEFVAQVWDVRSGQSHAVFRAHNAWIRGASFSSDGSRVLTVGDGGPTQIWDARNGRLRATLQSHHGGTLAASFSPDGARVVTAGYDGMARVSDAISGQLLATLQGHTAEITIACFSPDGSRVLTASKDHTARLWDARSGQLQATLQGHTDAVTDASFSPDGLRVLTSSADGTAMIWVASLDGWITQACNLLRWQPEFAAVAHDCLPYLGREP